MRTIREAFSMGTVFGVAMVLAMAMREPPQASDPYLGQIAWVPYFFAPQGWHTCDGSIMSIAQNTALFALLGTTYGGNGQTTFALPDLRGRVPISVGQGPGLSNYDLGQMGGVENTTLLTSQMPAHTHPVSAHSHPIGPLQLNLMAASGKGDSLSPVGNVLATSLAGEIYTSAAATAAMGAAGATFGSNTGDSTPAPSGTTGGGQPFSTLQPYNTLRCIIALYGVFPPQNREK